MSIRLVIILIIHIVFLKRILSNREIMNWIYSPRITEWGKWGSKELCPINSWVCGMTSKIGVLNETGFGDTKLNAIELQCANIDWFHTGMISSATGTWGTYGKTRYCPKGFATGFQLRSVSSGYDVGAVDFRLKCTNFDGTTSYVNNAEYEPPWGVWTAEQLCPPKAAICGIQTQVKSSTVGSTSLNNVDLACCKLPEPEITETCKLEYKWQTIVFCRQAKKKCEMKFRIGIAENDTMSKFYQKLGFIVDLHVVKNNLKLKARNAYQINSKTLENIIDETEVEESRISIQLDCEGLGQQLILRCGSYQVLTNQYRCIPNRNQGKFRIKKISVNKNNTQL